MMFYKLPKKIYYLGITLAGFILIIPFLSFNSQKPVEKYTWPESGLAVNLPQPKSNKGNIVIDDDDNFYMQVEKVSSKDYDKYLEKCKDKGFTKDSDSSKSSYNGYNEEGYYLSLSYFESSKSLSISLDREKDEYETVEKNNDTTTKESTKETSEENDIQNESPTKEPLEEKKMTVKENDNPKPTEKIDTKKSDTVNPDLKEFLDSYEEFIDDYIAFMEKYENSSNDIGMLSDYTEFMSKYSDLMDKLSEYDESTMSDVDAAYYLEVTSRCTLKLQKASL